MSEIFEQVTERTLTVLPEGNVNRHLFLVAVSYRGQGLWAVRHQGYCLAADGSWDYESIPSERTEEWLAKHRFPEDEAMRRAREVLPKLTINGLTVDEVLARVAERAKAVD